MTRHSDSAVRRRCLALGLVAILVTIAGCSSKNSGPNLATTATGLPNVVRTTANALGLTAPEGDDFFESPDSIKSTADVFAAKLKPAERTDDADGDIFLLYSSGTVWFTKAATEGKSAIVVYRDNDRAYRRHGSMLGRNIGWLPRVGGLRTENNFRGGGSSFGK